MVPVQNWNITTKKKDLLLSRSHTAFANCLEEFSDPEL